VVLRQPHRAGEKCFVDFCDGLALIDPDTGDRIPTQLFVGALGASSFTFARATLSQELPVRLDCHVRMYEAFDGVASIMVPDNLRSAIASPDRYEAEINPAYRELAEHYGTCIIPARVRKPRDEAKVEAAVLVESRSEATAPRPGIYPACSHRISQTRLRGAASSALVTSSHSALQAAGTSEVHDPLERMLRCTSRGVLQGKLP
jgi:hypothetical protein